MDEHSSKLVKDLTIEELKDIIREVLSENITIPIPTCPPFPPDRTWYTNPNIPDKGPWC